MGNKGSWFLLLQINRKGVQIYYEKNISFHFASVTIMNLINQLMSYLQAIAAVFYGGNIKLERHNSIASATWSYCLTLSFILWEKIKLCLGRQTFLAAFFVHILLFFQRCYFCFLYLLWSFRFFRWVKSTENFLFDVFL